MSRAAMGYLTGKGNTTGVYVENIDSVYKQLKKYDFKAAYLYLKDGQSEPRIDSSRVQLLHNIQYDDVLNAVLEANLLLAINMDLTKAQETTAGLALEENLKKAHMKFILIDVDLNAAKEALHDDVLAALHEATPFLAAKKNWTTPFAMLASLIISIGTLGLANAISGRTMTGFFSSKIDLLNKAHTLEKSLGIQGPKESNAEKPKP